MVVDVLIVRHTQLFVIKILRIGKEIISKEERINSIGIDKFIVLIIANLDQST